MLARDHYATLGVPPTASGEEIEEAFRHLSRRYHPGINPGDPHAALVYERIQTAYAVLCDPERRARYDREGSLAPESETGDLGLGVQLVPDADDGGSWAELFDRLREHRLRGAPARGGDVAVSVEVPLAQVEHGRRAAVSVRRRVPCTHCSGRGRVQLQRKRPCERCQGSGQESFVKGPLSVSCACADCGGDGLRAGVDCSDCQGTGLKLQSERVLLRVPPGVRDHHELRVPGKGHHGARGGAAGDLVARCLVQRVPGFERHGPHLHTSVAVSLAEAVLGAKVEVPVLEGPPALLRVPPMTQGGSVLRLRGQGLELPDGRRGDMLVRIEIRIPERVDEDSKELVRRFAARNPGSPRAKKPSES